MLQKRLEVKRSFHLRDQFAYFFTLVTEIDSITFRDCPPVKICWRAETGNDRIFEVLVTHICTYLAAEYRDHSENLTNRKLSIFYIETMSQLFSQLRKKTFFFGMKNIFRNIFRSKIFFVDFSENQKISSKKNLNFQLFLFLKKFPKTIFGRFFFKKS